MSTVPHTPSRPSTSHGRPASTGTLPIPDARAWSKLSPQHQQALENYMTLERIVPKRTLPNAEQIFAMSTEAMVIDGIANALSEYFGVKNSDAMATFRSMARNWHTSQARDHYTAMVNYKKLRGELSKRTLPNAGKIFAMETPEQVSDAIALALAERCKVSHTLLIETFKKVARMTSISPAIMTAMFRAKTWLEFCQAIPEGMIRQACGSDVITGAIERKPVKPIEVPTRRTFRDLIGNADQFA